MKCCVKTDNNLRILLEICFYLKKYKHGNGEVISDKFYIFKMCTSGYISQKAINKLYNY
jgi:hypothetical protein